MDAAVMPDCFSARYQGGAAQTEFLRQMDQPVTDWLALVPVVLLGEESDLVSVHGLSLLSWLQSTQEIHASNDRQRRQRLRPARQRQHGFQAASGAVVQLDVAAMH